MFVISPLHCPLQVNNNKANTVTSPKDTGPAPALVYTHHLSYTHTKPLHLPTSRHTVEEEEVHPFTFICRWLITWGEMMDVHFNTRLSLNEIVCKSFNGRTACPGSSIYGTANHQRRPICRFRLMYSFIDLNKQSMQDAFKAWPVWICWIVFMLGSNKKPLYTGPV